MSQPTFLAPPRSDPESNPAASAPASLGLQETAVEKTLAYVRFLAAPVGKIAEIKTHYGLVLQVAFAPDGVSALSSAADGTISLWDLQTGEEVRQYLGHTGAPRRLAAAGKYVISSGSTDHTVRLWDLDSGRELHCYSLGSYCAPAAISPDGSQVLFAANNNGPYVASTQDFKEVQIERGEGIYAVAWSPSGRLFATGGWNRVVHVYNARTEQEIARLPQPDQLYSLAFTPDDRKVLAGDTGNHVRIFDIQSRQVLHQFDAGGWRSIVVTPDSRYALAPSGEPTLFFWDLATGKPSNRFEGQQNAVTAVDISKDGNLALSGDKDGSIRLWRLPATRPAAAVDFPAEELPSDEAVRSAQSTVNDVFRGDYRWVDAKGREELFRKVRRQASDPKNDPSVQYAILLEAARIAASSGDEDLVIWVSGELARRYPRASLEQRMRILSDAAEHAATTVDVGDEVGDGLLALSDDAGWAGDFATALRAAQRADSLLMTPHSAEKVQIIRELAARADSMKDAYPKESAGMGVFFCFGTGQLDLGLPMLARSEDPQLAAVAAKEAEGASNPQDAILLADRYMEIATDKDRSALVRSGAAGRATWWYGTALPRLDSADRSNIEKKLAESRELSVWVPRPIALESLRTALLSSPWGWYDMQLWFRDDGTVSHVAMQGRWAIASPRLVVITVGDGDTLYLHFNAELTHFKSLGQGFGGSRFGR